MCAVKTSRARDHATNRLEQITKIRTNLEGFRNEVADLNQHINITQGYNINAGKNLRHDPYYVQEFARLMRLIAIAEDAIAILEGATVDAFNIGARG